MVEEAERTGFPALLDLPSSLEAAEYPLHLTTFS